MFAYFQSLRLAIGLNKKNRRVELSEVKICASLRHESCLFCGAMHYGCVDYLHCNTSTGMFFGAIVCHMFFERMVKFVL